MQATGEGFTGGYKKPDPFQAIWDDPARVAQSLYVHERFMVRPDDSPVVPHHLLVIARRELALEALPLNEYLAMWALARLLFAHMTAVLAPKRKVSMQVWGNQVQTAHIHLVPRNNPEDATVWKPMGLSGEALETQLAETRRLLTFPSGLKVQADQLVDEALKLLAGTTLPPVLPTLPISGKKQQ
ncbi:MAG TPA: HIT domain-containing protein [Candidatus Saccharimonadales bacterium]|nr:HIT domain-containing protein [Candidatus Saccharimonadales bacterium]